MAFQKYFRENFVNRLFGDVESNLSRYIQDAPWAAAYAAGRPFELTSRIQLPDGFALALPEKDDLKDFENTQKLYEALKSLTPVQATDPRLWTYMTHLTFWTYMRRRWQLEESTTKPENRRDYVLSHYFVRSAESRALLRNGIARLWWYGFLTHDPNRENPYELTGILLKQLDIAQQILERSLGRNRDILHSFLIYLLDHSDLTEGDKGRSAIRAIAKRLNLRGGVCVLDELGKAEIRRFLDETGVAVGVK
jgi:hypothetical protein